MIPVTKPYLPAREKLDKYIDGIYEREWLTNNGPLVQELTNRLEEYLGVENLLLVSNGTLALQIAYSALGVSTTNRDEKHEAITTPFTFVATASSLKWEGVEPVFADIDPDTWCLDPKNIEKAITPNTKAIVPVHVFGNACEVEAIDDIATEHHLKVIYDAAHAFGVNYKGESLLRHGDAATLSFHATKVFHTVEGGAIIFKRKEDLERAKHLISFGITGPDQVSSLGINAKMSEFQAAMGLAMLDDVEPNVAGRKRVWTRYHQALSDTVQLPSRPEEQCNNYAYFPLVVKQPVNGKTLVQMMSEQGVQVRRYFAPSLDQLQFMSSVTTECEVSRAIAEKVICLPLYSNLSESEAQHVINAFINGVGNA